MEKDKKNQKNKFPSNTEPYLKFSNICIFHIHNFDIYSRTLDWQGNMYTFPWCYT